jgi:murein DD-endopeptidase MepM/ murein hydrolase activator NlpD
MSTTPSGRVGRGGHVRPGRARHLLAIAALTMGLLAAFGAPVPARAAAAGRAGGPAIATPPPAFGQQGPPIWLPLRRDLNGGDIKVGCTYDSHGSQFGYECGGHHDRWALDLLATTGTPVYAAGKGYATNLTGRSGGGGFGNVIQVDHGGGVVTIYGHLSKVLIAPQGQWVDQNTLIGLVGSTGTSSAPHLHFEKRNLVYGAAVDPGPLQACRMGVIVRYPNAAGPITWKGLPWGAIHIASDGTNCAPKPAPTPVTPAVPSAGEGELTPAAIWLAVADVGNQFVASLARLAGPA